VNALRDGRLTYHQEEDSPMATKRRKKAGKPERVIGVLTKAGKVKISKAKLAAFRKYLTVIGISSPKVRFVARNAPFMRRPAIPPV
jgi:hypothetical protein